MFVEGRLWAKTTICERGNTLGLALVYSAGHRSDQNSQKRCIYVPHSTATVPAPLQSPPLRGQTVGTACARCSRAAPSSTTSRLRSHPSRTWVKSPEISRKTVEKQSKSNTKPIKKPHESTVIHSPVSVSGFGWRQIDRG